jgi:hypothetical protein
VGFDPKLSLGTLDDVVKTMTQLWEKKTKMGGAALPGRRAFEP